MTPFLQDSGMGEKQLQCVDTIVKCKMGMDSIQEWKGS